MSKARDLADFQGSASALTTGTLPVDRVPYVGRRNLIINGGFDVWQRGTSFSSNGYTADRWFSYLSDVTIVSANTLNEGNYVQVTVNSGTSIATIEQRLENPAQYHNKTLTLSYNVFGTPTATNGLKYEIALNHNGGRTIITSGDAGVGSGRKVLTFNVGDLSSYTLSSSSYLEIRPLIYYQENTWTGAIGISEVQLELGSVATPFEHRSYGEELALCQRYYLRLVPATTSCFIPHYGQTSNHMRGAYYLPCEMRATPSGVKSGNMYATDANGSTAIDSISVQNMQGNQLNVNMWHTGSNRNGTSYYYSCTVEFDAEL
jgi:hypothetical protein